MPPPLLPIPTLAEFLDTIKVEGLNVPPALHTTHAVNIYDIINDGGLTPPAKSNLPACCYLFVGRPAFKWESNRSPSEFEAPLVFVFRDLSGFSIDQIHPFDTGAFESQMFPDYITKFKLESYKLGTDSNIIGRLISAFFGTFEQYMQGNSLGEKEVTERFKLSPRHHKIRALARLYADSDIAKFDDRAKTIEVRVTGKVDLLKVHLIGIIIPHPLLADEGLLSILNTMNCVIEDYPVYPLRVDQFFALIYDRVRKIMRERAGW